jgi:hypothetical protein
MVSNPTAFKAVTELCGLGSKIIIRLLQSVSADKNDVECSETIRQAVITASVNKVCTGAVAPITSTHRDL